jgi:hypothetical protein
MIPDHELPLRNGKLFMGGHMATNEGKKDTVLMRVTEQRVDLRPSGNDDVRKGVNVLNTSDPKNPAPNPFVQNQNGTQGTKEPNATNQGKSKESE